MAVWNCHCLFVGIVRALRQQITVYYIILSPFCQETSFSCAIFSLLHKIFLPKSHYLRNFLSFIHRNLNFWSALGGAKKNLEEEGFPERTPSPPKPTIYQSRSHRSPSNAGIRFWREKTLGRGKTSWKKFTPSQTHPPQELSHHAPSKISTDFSLWLGRSAVGISFLGGYGFVLWLTCFCLCQKSNFLFSRYESSVL